MKTTTVVFPPTDVVRCVFSLRQSNNILTDGYDEYDRAARLETLKRYAYKLPKSLVGHVFTGDFVVVHCKTGYQICEVVEVNASVPPATYKTLAPVVCKVDITSYVHEVEAQKYLESMRAKIEQEKNRLEKESLYDLIAEKNPAFKQMLDTFREMGGSL